MGVHKTVKRDEKANRTNILIALLLSFLSGAIIGVFLILFGKKGIKSQIPFGPFLSGSTIITMLFGSSLLSCFEFLFLF